MIYVLPDLDVLPLKWRCLIVKDSRVFMAAALLTADPMILIAQAMLDGVPVIPDKLEGVDFVPADWAWRYVPEKAYMLSLAIAVGEDIESGRDGE